jgi:hypothetical protein
MCVGPGQKMLHTRQKVSPVRRREVCSRIVILIVVAVIERMGIMDHCLSPERERGAKTLSICCCGSINQIEQIQLELIDHQ